MCPGLLYFLSRLDSFLMPQIPLLVSILGAVLAVVGRRRCRVEWRAVFPRGGVGLGGGLSWSE